MYYHSVVSGFLLALALLGLTQLSPTSNLEVLPATLDGWQRAEVRRAEAARLEDLADRDAGLWREYGAARAERAVYRRGSDQMRVTVFVFRDATGTYGAFSFLGANGRKFELGEAARQTETGWVFYQGRYCVTATASPGVNPSPALQTLAQGLAAEAARVSPLPSLLGFLPREGLQANSERYLLGPAALARVAPLGPGDWLGFAYGVEAVWAEYSLDGRPVGFLLASYPTPQLAADRLREFSERFNLNGTGDPARRLVYAKRVGPLIGLLAGVDSGSTASRLLNQLRYEYQLTWSEPTEEPTASEWSRILVGIFIGTGLMILYALACGLLFAGIRVLIQHYLPGKVFHRPEGTEIIRLEIGKR